MDLSQYAAIYRRELLESVIPFWLRHGFDEAHGGFFTCLSREGDVYDTRKYVWLQGRNLWTFSKLYNDVEPREEWLSASRSTAAFLRKNAYDPQGRCYFSLTREGAPAGYQRKPYAAVFVCLGLLEFAKATGDEAIRREAIDLFWRIEAWIKTPALMDRPQLSGAAAMSSLADIMVRASLALEIAAVDPDPRYPAIMAECLDLAFVHLHPTLGIFMENARPRGVSDELPEDRLACPGSSIEVAWFLLHVLERLPDARRRDQLLGIIEASLEYGWDREYGGLYYFMDTAGRPPLQLEADMKLWWPHTEAIYALVLAHSIEGGSRWRGWLDRVHDYAFAHFSDPTFGEWFGYCDRRGNLTHTLKGNNYKGAFHVPRFLLFSMQRIEAKTSSGRGAV